MLRVLGPICRIWLFLQVRRKDKKPYPADTLMQIASGLQRYLRQVLCRADVNFFDKYSDTFAEFREALKSRSGELSLESHSARGETCERFEEFTPGHSYSVAFSLKLRLEINPEVFSF